MAVSKEKTPSMNAKKKTNVSTRADTVTPGHANASTPKAITLMPRRIGAHQRAANNPATSGAESLISIGASCQPRCETVKERWKKRAIQQLERDIDVQLAEAAPHHLGTEL
jgi:hypothetical protein